MPAASGLPFLALLLTGITPALVHAWDVKLPWRGDALPANQYMETKGHGGYNCPNGAGGGCGNDIVGIRWDASAGSFSYAKTGIVPVLIENNSTTYTRSNSVAWAMELYSPVDGQIIACWSGIPDDEEDGSDPAACPGEPGEDDSPLNCQNSGNLLVILTDDNHLVSLSHLKYQSIPIELCPNDDGVVVQTDEQQPCDLAGYDEKGVVRDLNILDEPIDVFKGDFIGKVGVSGAAAMPHLHIGTYEYAEDAQGDMCQKGIPLEFAETWSQQYTTTVAPTVLDWARDVGSVLDYDGVKKYLLWADPIGPIKDTDTLGVSSATAVALTATGGVAAYQPNGTLFFIPFNYTASGVFVGGSGDTMSAVDDLAIARIDDSSDHVVAVFPNAADKLQLAPYYVDSGHNMIESTNRTETTAGVGQVEATRAPTPGGVVVALKNSLDGISVIHYRVTSAGGTALSITREDDAESAPAVADLDIATMTQGRSLSELSGAFKGVVTVERADNGASSGPVRLRTWKIDGAHDITPIGNTLVPGISASEVDITVTGSGGREFVIVSMATTSGLRVQNWTVSTLGALAFVEEYDGGPVTHIDSARVGQRDAVVGARISTGQMSLLSFHVELDGRLRRVGTVDGANISSIFLDGNANSRDLVVMPAASPSNVALMQHYTTNYNSGL